MYIIFCKRVENQITVVKESSLDPVKPRDQVFEHVALIIMTRTMLITILALMNMSSNYGKFMKEHNTADTPDYSSCAMKHEHSLNKAYPHILQPFVGAYVLSSWNFRYVSPIDAFVSASLEATSNACFIKGVVRKEVIVYSPLVVARRDGGLLYGSGSELDMKGFSVVCDTDDDCLKFFPDNPYPMECINSICLSLTD
ncbi:hypothetical protein MTR_6g038490 [Medicago truncatula]|uniref:Uncharacterized protein n=1 Tax=Medicago truncatula TaxID=3880 RepID=A0A072U884_MEDTR|nr:hypothetical protein MTR_6g038490 [Medicago truncatula]